MWIVDILLKIPSFRVALIHKAFKLTYVDRDEWAKTEHAFTDSKGQELSQVYPSRVDAVSTLRADADQASGNGKQDRSRKPVRVF
jgi:hypothetical protein